VTFLSLLGWVPLALTERHRHCWTLEDVTTSSAAMRYVGTTVHALMSPCADATGPLLSPRHRALRRCGADVGCCRVDDERRSLAGPPQPSG
jgi:hypothetical protein